MKPTCKKCGAELRVSKSNANRGQTTKCRSCYRRDWYEANRDAIKEQSREYYEATRERRLEVARQVREEHPERHRANARKFKLKSKYGITPEEYDVMFAAQKGLCFLCGKQEPKGVRLAVDHCHKEKRVRKLLCRVCNLLLGRIEADAQWLTRALDYLKTG